MTYYRTQKFIDMVEKHKLFHTCYKKNIYDKIKKYINHQKDNTLPSGFNKEILSREHDLYSIRVNRNIRIIFQETDDTTIFRCVDKHDRAIDFANNFKGANDSFIEFITPPKTEPVEEKESLEKSPCSFETASYSYNNAVKPYFFDSFQDSHFKKMGLNEAQIATVRAINTYGAFCKLGHDINPKSYRILRRKVIRDYNIYDQGLYERKI